MVYGGLQSILKDEVFSIHQKNSVTTDKYNEKVLTNANNNIQKTNFYLENKSGYSLLQSKMDKILSNIKKNSHQPLFSEIENSKENQQKLISDSNILAEYYLEDRHLVMSPSKIDKLNKNDFSLELINIPDNVKKYITLKELLTKEKVTNVELLLSIVEITSNYKYYQLNDFSNQSKIFWQNVVNIEELKKIFGTNVNILRNYWRNLKLVNDLEDILCYIIANKDFIELTHIR